MMSWIYEKNKEILADQYLNNLFTFYSTHHGITCFKPNSFAK